MPDAPPLSKPQEAVLHDLYYNKKLLWGRDKIYRYLQDNGFEKHRISRRQVNDWLKKQNIHQLYEQTKKTKDIQPTIMKEPYKQLACDLIDMQDYEHNGYNYILSVIDLFTKKGWCEPTKGKSDKLVRDAMKKVIDSIDHHISSLRSDNGSEFTSEIFKKLLNDHEIKQVLSSAGTPQSNGAVENFNKNIKTRLKMIITHSDSNDWVSQLPQIVDNYNNIRSRITKKTPNELDKLAFVKQTGNEKVDQLNEANKKQDIEQNIKNIKNSVQSKNNINAEQKFEKGDKVRLKMTTKENYKLKNLWSKELYTVYKVFKPRNEYSRFAYYVEDDDKKYTDKLYNEDLQKVDIVENPIKEPKVYEVSKIIEKRINKDKSIDYLVAWKGYRSIASRTWESEETLKRDVPKMLKQFNKK